MIDASHHCVSVVELQEYIPVRQNVHLSLVVLAEDTLGVYDGVEHTFFKIRLGTKSLEITSLGAFDPVHLSMLVNLEFHLQRR